MVPEKSLFCLLGCTVLRESGGPGASGKQHTIDLLAPHVALGRSCPPFSHKYVEAGLRGVTPVSPGGPTSRATTEGPGLILRGGPALLLRDCCLGSKRCSLHCRLAPFSGAGSNVSYLIGNLTWLLNNRLIKPSSSCKNK